ncbi:hypothetical protein GKJPGBOP_01589 [Streptomyces paromomycinus]|uniref:Chaplin domain-containing protein n=1 Tax=Streptomyces paromomycinus TaxID=92743 RepID=A0A401VY23_STREY|nr:hypothetical protein GKJPGBOP_01589 [Streptomyces paromomycinus]
MTALALTGAMAGVSVAVAPVASAGGIGVLLSPAFGTLCANRPGAHASGATTGGGPVSNNIAKVPFTTPLNHCGGADMPGNRQGNEAPDDDPGIEYMANQSPGDTRYPGGGQTDFLKLLR